MIHTIFILQPVAVPDQLLPSGQSGTKPTFNFFTLKISLILHYHPLLSPI